MAAIDKLKAQITEDLESAKENGYAEDLLGMTVEQVADDLIDFADYPFLEQEDMVGLLKSLDYAEILQ